jgi:hypothetical protein
MTTRPPYNGLSPNAWSDQVERRNRYFENHRFTPWGTPAKSMSIQNDCSNFPTQMQASLKEGTKPEHRRLCAPLRYAVPDLEEATLFAR